MQRRFVNTFLLVASSSLLILACDSGGDGGTQPPPPPAVTVSYSSPAPTISEGDTITVSANASDGSAVTYSSSSAGVATVSPSGLVTGVGAGTATITASSGSASATLDVTVNTLTPSIEIDEITQNGQPVDESNVAGTVMVTLTAEIGNAFDGEVAIFAGNVEVATAPLSGAGGGALTAALDAVSGHDAVTAGARSIRRTFQAAAPLDVVSTDGDFLANGPTDMTAILRQLPSGIQIGNASSARTLILNQPDAGIVRIRGVSATGGGRDYVAPTSLDGVYINRDPTDTRTVTFGEISIDQVAAIDVLRGPAGTLYGAAATQGVVSIAVDKDTDYTAGGNAVGGITGHYEIGSFRVRLTDNTWVDLDLLNGSPGFEPKQQWWDTWSPSHATGTWNLPAGTINWWGPNVDLDQWGLGVGGDWTNGDIADAGVGLDACEAYTGPDLTNWTRTLNSNDIGETLTASVRYSYLCRDKLGNDDFLWLNNPMGVDRTAGTFDLRVGANYLATGLNQNPANGTALGFTGTDTGSGVDLTAAYLGIGRIDVSGLSYDLGSDDGAGGITPEHVDLTTPGEYASLDYDAAALFRLGYQFSDKAKNLTAIEYLWYANDDESPDAANVTASSSLVSGQDATFTWDVTDNLAIRRVWTVADYGRFRLLLDRDVVWKRDDTDLQQSRSGSVTSTWIGSVEGVPNGQFAPDGTSWQAMGVWTYTDDLAGNGDDEWIDIQPRSSGGRTLSFGLNGMDWVGFVNYSPNNNDVCTPEPDTDCGNIPTKLPVTVETRYTGTGSSDVTSFQLFAEVPFSANPSVTWLMPISARVNPTLQDNGGWFQQFGDLEIDMTVNPFTLLPEDYESADVPVRVGAFDDDNNVLFSDPREYRFHVGFRF